MRYRLAPTELASGLGENNGDDRKAVYGPFAGSFRAAGS